MQQIKIHIDKEGRPTIKAEGFSGNDCLAATKPLEDLIGDPVTRERTGNAYGPQETRGEAQVGQ